MVLLASCSNNDLTFEELQRAKWDSAGKGFYYISIKDVKGISVESDSIEIKLKGVAGNRIDPFGMSIKEIPDIVRESLTATLKKRLPNSESGYLKINFTEMLKPENLTGTIFLMGDYSGLTSYDRDSAALNNIPEIRSFAFISKEEAKKKWLADGNSDWDSVLDANPLPNAIEIVLENRDWSEVSLHELENKIRDRLIMVSNISFPTIHPEKSQDCFFFEYRRYRKP